MLVLQSFDTALLGFINSYFHNSLLDSVMPMITALGNGGIVWVLLSAVLLLNRKYRFVGLLTVSAILLSSLLGEGILKHLIQRPRPFMDIPAINLLIAKPLTYSFPSGHTASSFAAAGILGKKFRQYRIPIYILAALIAFSRMYLYVHYPTDILGGILLGFICSKIVLYFYELKGDRASMGQRH